MKIYKDEEYLDGYPIEDEVEVAIEPTDKERIEALEAAMLDLILGGESDV